MCQLTVLTDELWFPPLEQALEEPDGLLALGGDLSVERLTLAYRHGCFPWFNEGEPVLWWSPDPRMVLFPEKLHISKSMAKLIRQHHFQVTFDRCFSDVIKACAEPRDYTDQTWISPEIQEAYTQLHKKGVAHSVEVWLNNQLVGGLYGIAMGQLFFGESMFSRVSNASKYGFIMLVSKLKSMGVQLIDCQMHTSHLQSLGAELISRKEFAGYLEAYIDKPTHEQW